MAALHASASGRARFSSPVLAIVPNQPRDFPKPPLFTRSRRDLPLNRGGFSQSGGFAGRKHRRFRSDTLVEGEHRRRPNWRVLPGIGFALFLERSRRLLEIGWRGVFGRSRHQVADLLGCTVLGDWPARGPRHKGRDVDQLTANVGMIGGLARSLWRFRRTRRFGRTPAGAILTDHATIEPTLHHCSTPWRRLHLLHHIIR